MPTVLLCHCDGINGSITFTDASPSVHTLAVNNGAVVGTGQVKFGSGAADMTAGASARITVGGTTSDFDFQSTPFTIECWAYASSAPATASLVSQFNNTAGGGWFFGSVAGTLQMWCYDGSATQRQITTGTAIPTGAWHHYAVDRDAGGLIRLYLDGAVVGSLSVPTFQSAALQANIGNSTRGVDGWLIGYIDEVRVTKGTALYAGAFTPPTAPFTDSSGVKEMSFVAGRNLVLGAATAVPLPMMVDAGGNGNSYSLYSHMRVPGGTTYTFDVGGAQVVPATTDSVIAIPPGATQVTATAASTAQLGQMQ